MTAAVTAGVSVAAARRLTAEAFRQGGIDSPELDARLIVGHALGMDHAQLASASERVLHGDEAAAVAALAGRRLAREPVARILGVKEFWGLELRLSPATLVPRPETETVVEAALQAVDAGGMRNRPLRIADLGVGSGALLLALLSELPHAIGAGTDASLTALQTARANAIGLGLHERAYFVACDFASALEGPFDLIVSNPPYIASGDIPHLAPEVRDHDPPLALDGGPDGLAGYRRIATDARRIMGHDGTLVLELGAGQAEGVALLLEQAGLAACRPFCDLAGHFRALPAHRAHAEMPSPGPKIPLGLSSGSD